MMDEIKVLKQENMELKGRLQSVESKFNNYEQKEKQNNIVISGVPRQEKEDTMKIVSAVISTLKLNIKKEDISETYRLGKKMRPQLW